MRILVVIVHPGKAELVLWREVARQGVDLELAVASGGPSAEVVAPEMGTADFCPVSRFTPLRVPRRDQLWWVYPGLLGLIGRGRFDLVHVVSEPWGLLVHQALRGASPVSVHSADNIYVHGGALERRLRLVAARRNLARLCGLVSWNSRGLELARANGLRAAVPTEVIPAVLPAQHRTPDLDSTRRYPVMFAGRLEHHKGIDVFLDACRRLDAGGQPVVIGDGSQRWVVEAAAREGLVDYRGPLSHRETLDLMADVDVVVVPSVDTDDWSEQFGRVALEAMAMGCVVVASVAGALPELVGAAGVLVPQGDPRTLAAELERVLENPAGLRDLRRAATRRAGAFSPDSLGARIADHFRAADVYARRGSA